MDSQLKENVFLPISDQELNRRWSAVRKEMKKQEIDCLVIQNSEAHMGGYVRWFIDIPAKFGTPLTVLFPADDEMTVITEGNTPDLVLPDWMMRGIKENIVRPYYRSIHYTDSLDGQAAVEAIRKNGYKKCAPSWDAKTTRRFTGRNPLGRRRDSKNLLWSAPDTERQADMRGCYEWVC